MQIPHPSLTLPLLIFIFLSSYPAPTLTSPISSSSSSLLPRTQPHCSNAPAVLAGTQVHPCLPLCPPPIPSQNTKLTTPPPRINRFFHPRTLPLPLTHRKVLPPRQRGQAIVYCTPSTTTWIRLLMGPIMHAAPIQNMLNIAIATLESRIVESGDRPLSNGQFIGTAAIGPGLNLVLQAVNANNHQTTRGVLRAALVALEGYMQEWGWGEVFLEIYDGDNMVGKAAVRTEMVAL